MGATTMSFSLTPELRDYIDLRVRSGAYGNTSEFLRELLRKDRDEQAKAEFCRLIEHGLRSGPGRPWTPELAAELRERAFRGGG